MRSGGGRGSKHWRLCRWEVPSLFEGLLDRLLHLNDTAVYAIIGMLARSIRYISSTHDKVKKAQQAQDFLQEMKVEWNLAPNTIIFSHVLHALAQTGVAEAGDRANSVLDDMLKQYHQSQTYCEPKSMTQQRDRTYVEDEISFCKPNN